MKEKRSKRIKIKNRITKKNISLKVNGKRLPIQHGWIRIKIYGNAFERGFAHGYLLAKELQEISDSFTFIVREHLKISYKTYEKYCREKITPEIQKHFLEFFEEIQGISAGAIAAGYPKVTLDFIIAWNSLLSTYTMFPERCSSLITIYNGNIVMAHNTQTDFITGQSSNIIMEICPSIGNRMILQMSPGFICSGMDWFIVENGIIGCESTIGDINYTPTFGAPYFCRIRQAMQYGNSLDDYVKIMLKNNAGDYPCTWLLGDINKKEIMQFELAKKYHSVQKKKEGVFYGMNSVHDVKIRKLETDDLDYGDTNTSSGARNMRLHYLLYEKYAGNMTIENTKKIIADHYDVYLDKETKGNNRSICKHTNLDPEDGNRDAYYPFGCTDAKIVDSTMAKRMTFIGRFGNSCGTEFNVHSYLKKHPKYNRFGKYLKNMPSQPWIELKPI
jgi:hypothetical protein